MDVYYWSVALAACIGGMFVPGLELPFGIAALGSAVGGGIALARTLRAKSSKENRTIVGGRNAHRELIERHDTHGLKLDGIDQKADAQRAEIKELQRRITGGQSTSSAELEHMRTLLNATVIDKERVEEIRQALQNWHDYMFPIFNASVDNDLLGWETVSNLQRLLTESDLTEHLRIVAAMEHIVMYHNERKVISGQPNPPQ